MKIRNVISTILMTLLSFIALTTATYAWYAARSAEVFFESSSVDITTSPKTSGLIDLNVNWEVLDGASADKLVLTDTSGKTYAVVKDGDEYKKILGVVPNGCYPIIRYRITISADPEDIETLKALAGTYTATIEVSNSNDVGGLRINKKEAYYNEVIKFDITIDANGNITNNVQEIYVSCGPMSDDTVEVIQDPQVLSIRIGKQNTKEEGSLELPDLPIA